MARWHLKTISILPEDFVEKLSEGVFRTTPEGKYLFCNQRLADIYRYDSKEELFKALTDIENKLYVDRYRRKEFMSLMEKQGRVENFDSEIKCKTGETIWIRENAWVEKDLHAQKIISYNGTVTDITEQKKLEQQIYFDALTGLPRRLKFENDLRRMLEKDPKKSFGLVLLEIEDFKLLKDTLGQVVLDHLVLKVKNILQNDAAVQTARIEQDQFVCFFEQPSKTQVLSFAKEMIEMFKQPFQYESFVFHLNCYLGIYIHEKNEESIHAAKALTNVQLACQQAKQQNRHHYASFEPSIEINYQQSLKMEADLRTAIVEDALELYYQPKHDLNTFLITGVEALARWRSKTTGEWIPPSLFIPLAEEKGLIYQLGDQMLRKALITLKLLQDKYQSLSMAVNVSVPQFFQENFVKNLFSMVDHFQVNPKNLKLEITENIQIPALERERMIKTLRELQEAGIQISLDDFGTGFSNLGYLAELPFNEVKIDQSFIKQNPHLKEQYVIDNILQMIRFLADIRKASVVGEGAETLDHIEYYKKLGCKEVQGFYLNKPMDLENLMKALDRNQRI